MPINHSEVRKFSKLNFLAKKEVEGFITGLHKSPYHGFSVEFAEHKPYYPGGDTKHIDWKLFAKTDKMFLKKYDEETNLRCQIILDVSKSMLFPEKDHNKLTHSINATAALSYLLQQQRDAVGVCTFSDDIIMRTPIKSNSLHINNIFHLLESIEGDNSVNTQTALAKAVNACALNLAKRSLVIIFSDFFENQSGMNEVFESLKLLKHQKHEIILFDVYDSTHEFDFEYSNRPHLFIDMETGEKIKTKPNEIKEIFQKRMESFKNDIKLKCHQYQIDFVQIDINKKLDQVLMAYLKRRDRLR